MEETDRIEVLLVEDSSADAELTIRALKKKGVTNNIVWLKDGAEALDYLFRAGAYENRAMRKPRMILLDLRMPKVDGLEVLRRLKAEPSFRAISVIMMTSSAEEPDITQAYALGVNSYIVKPIDFEHFTDAVCQAGMYWAVINRVPSG